MKKKYFLFIIFIVIICSLIFVFYFKKSNKTSPTAFATQFLTNYYSGKYQITMPSDTEDYSSKEKGIYTLGNIEVPNNISKLFTKNGLNEMLQDNKFFLVKDNNEKSLLKLSVKYTDSKDSNLYYDYTAKVNIQGVEQDIKGQLTLKKVDGTYKIERTWP